MDSYIIKDYITNKNIEVGDFTYYSGYYHGKHFEDYCVRYLSPDRDDVDKLKIGKFCSIGSGAIFIMAGNQGHRYDWITSYPFYYSTINENAKDGYIQSGDTVVGNDVWIGTEAVIMPGVKIGDGAVIGTRALVTKDVEPYTIIGGNPAKPIKKRFTQDEIKMLLEMKWWNWPIEKIKNNMLLLCSNNIKLLFEEFLNE
ncbi:CatB-related O-acetyltransferase [Tepidibacter hydrothermalis]|uniref:Chloramphenicol acetyltransferase n=2 Tax=Tepidibacter hydrothermalis TaxID=3036126 RepID=A0ABY8EK80_9FIRM|nr:CatB-related O-acetyltransferase [Tepidibacter hydrothermalis]WFD12349.1 CatB-related O-acetyltransferase [Tepidibacter hydrothermalis]